jgi:hypothetical protein
MTEFSAPITLAAREGCPLLRFGNQGRELHPQERRCQFMRETFSQGKKAP